MHLSFDNLNELDDFLRWSRDFGAMINRTSIPYGIEPQPPLSNDYVAEGCEQFADQAEQVIAETVAQNGEVTKRKRRTKAEIEADKAAQSAAATNALGEGEGEQAASAPVEALSPPVDANPFAAASNNLPQVMQQAMQQVSQQSAGTLAGLSVTQKTDPVTWIPARAVELGAVDAIEHMRKCREFIAAKGQQTYQKTFALAGVTSNVMSFSPEQCASHIAAQEWLLANPDA